MKTYPQTIQVALLEASALCHLWIHQLLRGHSAKGEATLAHKHFLSNYCMHNGVLPRGRQELAASWGQRPTEFPEQTDLCLGI